MAIQTLFSLSGTPGVGPIVAFSQSDNIRIFQFNPRPGVGFSGAFDIQESYTASPGGNDFQKLASLTFTNHTGNFSLEIESDAPWIRVNLVSSTVGEMAVYASSRTGKLSGNQGSALASSTVIVDSPKKSSVTGVNVHIRAPVVPQISSDDVSFAVDINKTVTDVLVDLTGIITPSGPDAADLAVLTGVTSGACTTPLTQADLCKLASITSTASQLNHTAGVTSNIQTQLDDLSSGKADGAGVDLTGLTVPASYINTFFDSNPTINVSGISTNLTGLISTAADLNGLAGTSGTFNPSDLTKLGSVISSASEINSLSGFTGSSTDLNKLVSLTASTADLNQVVGLAGVGVSTTEFTYLQGLSENVQIALNNVPSLGGLTATSADLNLLTGASTGTGAFANALTSAELNYITNVTSDIQAQLNDKRNIADPIGVAEISGASITTVELNYLQGSTANIQAQIDALTLGVITTSGGTFIGPIYIANGSAANPGLGYASANTTGLYLYGAPGIGLSVAGTRRFSLDSTDLTVGDAGTTGQPLLKHSGFGEANPAYSFVGDDNTGVFWDSADSISLSAGGERMVEADAVDNRVTLGGPAVTNNSVVVSGLFGGEKVLSTVSGLPSGVPVSAGSTGSVGTTPLYTVPAGRTAIITKIAVVLTAVAGFIDTTNFRLSIGFTGPAYDEIVDNVSNPAVFNPAGYAFDTPNQVMPLGYGDNTFPAISGSSGADYQALTAGAVLTANVSVLANATTYDFNVIVFGYEF